ncbi:hypothetical protein Trco_004655 [Trichoderma cornu-damae]|uniref:Uncharacterized protein n=1 Tax=Trichoderma cornu-damae TaxID=654480 RepID=A0A9P8QNA4_9HYPO|nr:hypothetical protein Trco_004655 [Trichoderma cornu-damae]
MILPGALERTLEPYSSFLLSLGLREDSNPRRMPWGSGQTLGSKFLFAMVHIVINFCSRANSTMASSPSSFSCSPNGGRYSSISDQNTLSRTESSSLSSLPPSTAKSMARLLAPDLQRGLLMALMAMDHVALGLNTWQHGTNIDGEMDGVIVRRWNFATAYIVRTLTHLCAPGFTFLLGMGIVFLSQSRTRLDRTEKWLREVLESHLLELDKRSGTVEGERAAIASSLSWHVHNILLVVLSVITIWWNIWLSDNHGHCRVETGLSDDSVSAQFIPSSQHPLLNIWFWYVASEHVMSNFPPMAWLSFAILGLVYGRVLSARKWTISGIAIGHISTGIVFSIVFVLTRLLRLGNLSEDCLHTPVQQHQAATENPYLASPASFFYIVKYPPDVAFWAFTMAINLFLLAADIAEEDIW